MIARHLQKEMGPKHSYGTPPKAVSTSKTIQLENCNEFLKLSVGSRENATNTGRAVVSCSFLLHQALIGKTWEHTEKPLLWCWLGEGNSSHCSATIQTQLLVSPAANSNLSSVGRMAQNHSPSGGSLGETGEWNPPLKLN